MDRGGGIILDVYRIVMWELQFNELKILLSDLRSISIENRSFVSHNKE